MRLSAWGTSLLALAALVADAEAAPSGASGPGTSWWSPGHSQWMQSLGVESWQDVFRPGRWQTTVDLGADGNLQETKAQDQSDARFSSSLTSEGVTVRNQGWSLIDPRLLTGDVGVRFAFEQARQDASDVATAQQGDVTDYFLYANLLEEKPYNASFLANHSEDITSQAGGGSTRSVSTNQGVTLNWREDSILRDRNILPYFSSDLQFRNEEIQQVTTNAGQSFRRDEQRKLVRFDAHNGFETGDLYVRAEDTDLQNRLFPAGSYRSRYADVTYGVDFGPYLDRHSDTHLNYSSRDGTITVSNLNFDQRFNLQHTDYLSTNYDYTFLQSESPAGATTAHRGDAGVQYSPYQNLSTGLNVFATHETFSTGTIDATGTYADANYQHPLPWSGQATVLLGGGLQFNNSQLQSSQIPVVDAPYQAPPALGAGASVQLKDSFIAADSIVVVDVRDGSRLPTTENVDYTVEVEGSRTRIVPLATSAVILPNDPLQISYYYLVDPSLESRTVTRSMYLSADWHWFALSASHDETRQVPLSGQESTLLTNQDRDSLRLDLRGDWDFLLARADGTVSRYRDTTLVYDEVRIGGQVSYRPNYFWQLSLTGSHSDTDFLVTNRQSHQDDARFDAAWSSASGWWGDAMLSYRTLRDTQVPPETVMEAIFKVRRRWSRLDFFASLGVGERTRGDLQTTYADVHLSAVRQF